MAADAKCFRKFSSVPAGSLSGSLSVCELQVNNFENFPCDQPFIEQFDKLFYRKVQWCYLDLVTSNLVTTSALVSINLPHKSFAFCDIMQFSDSFIGD